jgi:hypothetical protein
LAGLDHEIAGARKTLKALEVEIGVKKGEVEKVLKELKEREAQLPALRNEAQRMIAIRTEGEAVMAHLRMQLSSVQIGHRQ